MRTPHFTWRSCLFWLGLFAVSIYLQYLIQGVDILCIACIWTMHEERWTRFLWLAPTLILLQEGGGSMIFGTSILWYASMVALFVLGRCIFAVESIVFAILYSLAMGHVHFVLLNAMTGLQNIAVPVSSIFHDSLFQSACIFFAWAFVLIIRQRFMKHAHTI